MQSSHRTVKDKNGYDLYERTWLPDEGTDLKAVIQLSHGYAEHIERYEHVTQYFTDHGYAMFGIDLPHHGRSSGQKVLFDSMDYFIDAHENLYATIKDNYPNVPYFFLGHSLGSTVALGFTLRHQSEMQGLILSGTALGAVKVAPPPVMWFARLLRAILPKSRLLGELPTTTIAKNPATQKSYDEDPLVIKGNWYTVSLHTFMKYVYWLRENVSMIKLPLIMVHGEDDEITPIEGAHYLKQVVQSDDVSIHSYATLRHEVFNEVENEPIFAEIVAWLDNHI